MIKSGALAKDGSLYDLLHDPQERVVASAMVTCVMMVFGAGLSFFLPLLAVLAIIFSPGLLLFAFGGILPRRHYTYGLSTNQRLAIERYMEADKETKANFPKDFIQTVRSASTTRFKDEDYRLAEAAENIIKASKERQKALKLGNDKVEVALKIMDENLSLLRQDAQARREIGQ